ncbi:hypothetical protein FACS189431_0440 [Alphaproteobacteria bacterium]|nr:hypothetical protein FACS189431_0440 [Alphaproteobacteria bacterium]
MVKKILKAILAIILVLACAAGAFFGVKYYFDQGQTPEPVYEARSDLDNEQVTEDQIQVYIVEPDRPRYLSIPKLGITNARVMELGTVGADNRLDDPKNVNDAGWYRDSAKPGQATPQRPAGLYDGHNTGTSQKGIFYALGNLLTGDIITIERGDGKKFNYVVNEVSAVRLEDVDMSIMMQSITPGEEGLNIITCGGEWSKDNQTYTHRIVVRATLAS